MSKLQNSDRELIKIVVKNVMQQADLVTNHCLHLAE